MFSVVFILHLDLERMYEQSIKRSKKVVEIIKLEVDSFINIYLLLQIHDRNKFINCLISL